MQFEQRNFEVLDLGEGFVAAGGRVINLQRKLRTHAFYHGSPLVQKIYFSHDPQIDVDNLLVARSDEEKERLTESGLIDLLDVPLPFSSKECVTLGQPIIIKRRQEQELLILEVYADKRYIELFSRSFANLIHDEPDRAWMIAIDFLRRAPFLNLLLLPDDLDDASIITRSEVRLPVELLPVSGDRTAMARDGFVTIGEREFDR